MVDEVVQVFDFPKTHVIKQLSVVYHCRVAALELLCHAADPSSRYIPLKTIYSVRQSEVIMSSKVFQNATKTNIHTI